MAAGPPGGHCHCLDGAAEGVDGVRAAVREHPELPQFGLAELRAAVEEAHRHSLPVTAHAHGTRAVAQAVEVGVDGLEHVPFMTAAGVDPAPGDLVRTIADRHITVASRSGSRRSPA